LSFGSRGMGDVLSGTRRALVLLCLLVAVAAVAVHGSADQFTLSRTSTPLPTARLTSTTPPFRMPRPLFVPTSSLARGSLLASETQQPSRASSPPRSRSVAEAAVLTAFALLAGFAAGFFGFRKHPDTLQMLATSGTPAGAGRRSVAAKSLSPNEPPDPLGDANRPYLPLFLFGFVFGPIVDAIHNQSLLQYLMAPISLPLWADTYLKTSAVVPPLLGVAYVVLGSLFPSFIGRVIPDPSPRIFPSDPAFRALAAFATLCLITRLSVVLLDASLSPPYAFAILSIAALSQWFLIDRRRSMLLLATVAAVGGPVAEIPMVAAGLWRYISPDIFLPVPGLGLVGLVSLTGPCYFATVVAAVAVGECLASLQQSK